MEVYLHTLLENYDKPTNQPKDIPDHREVTISKQVIISIKVFSELTVILDIHGQDITNTPTYIRNDRQKNL